MQEAVKNKELAFSVMLPKVIDFLIMAFWNFISVIQETRQFEEIRNEYGFYSYETFAQISHAIELKCKHYARNFIQFARTQNQSLSDVELNLLIRILTVYSYSRSGLTVSRISVLPNQGRLLSWIAVNLKQRKKYSMSMKHNQKENFRYKS